MKSSVILRLAPILALAVLAKPALSNPQRQRRDANLGLQASEQEANLEPVELEPEVFGGDNGERTDREKRLLLEKKVQIGNSIKNTLLNLVFGKINQVIDTKTQLISVFDRANAIKNQQLLGPGTKRPPQSANPLKAVFGSLLSSSVGSLGSSSGGLSGGSGGSGGTGGSTGLGASFGASVGNSGGGFNAGASASASAGSSANSGNTNIPEFDENKVSLDIPDQLFGSGFTLVTNISEILGGLIMNTARRVQRFVESLKPGLRKFFGASASAKKRSPPGVEMSDSEENTAEPEKVDPQSVAIASAEFKSITGLEPFDFDFNALDRLVHSGDERRPSTPAPASNADLAASAKVASELLNRNLPSRTLSVRSPSPDDEQEVERLPVRENESTSRSFNEIPAFKPMPRSITDAFRGL